VRPPLGIPSGGGTARPDLALVPGRTPMRLAHLSLTDFRNYETLEIAFSPGHHLFLGENGAGKTNLLEAIHMLGVGSSMRGARDQTLVRSGARGYRVGGRFVDGAGGESGFRAEVHYEPGIGRTGGTKRFLLDKAPARASDLLAAIKVIAFAPADQELVQGSGSVRRRYLDTTGCQLSPEYIQLLREYQRALRQRNETLARAYVYEHGRNAAIREREPWTDLLVKVGGDLISRRRDLVTRLSAAAALVSASSYRGAGPLGIAYQPGFETELSNPESDLRIALAQSHARDEMTGYTTVGPHTDDLSLTLGGKDLRRFGSLGQQQLSAMFLKLAQASLVREIARVEPILLVDEMFAILDRLAAEEFLSRVESGGQIFLSTAQEGWLGELRMRRFHVHRVHLGAVISE
jgi:DNA replication and repair protein RecF